MGDLNQLFENNREWSSRIRREREGFFEKLAAQQTPKYLWIGCSDSRVPANELVGLMPGEIFVHRNVGNLVVHTDFNCLSVVQYAVEVLGIEEIIVCGHYGCGGVHEALKNSSEGLVNNWLSHLRDIQFAHSEYLESLAGDQIRYDRLCELNIIEQVRNVCNTAILNKAWGKGQNVTVHGWIYDIKNGLLKDLGVSVDNPDTLATTIKSAVQAICTTP